MRFCIDTFCDSLSAAALAAATVTAALAATVTAAFTTTAVTSFRGLSLLQCLRCLLCVDLRLRGSRLLTKLLRNRSFSCSNRLRGSRYRSLRPYQIGHRRLGRGHCLREG